MCCSSEEMRDCSSCRYFRQFFDSLSGGLRLMCAKNHCSLMDKHELFSGCGGTAPLDKPTQQKLNLKARSLS